ncbi:hypothetical protein, partial [Streptomyces xanthochromogenes]
MNAVDACTSPARPFPLGQGGMSLVAATSRTSTSFSRFNRWSRAIEGEAGQVVTVSERSSDCPVDVQQAVTP